MGWKFWFSSRTLRNMKSWFSRFSLFFFIRVRIEIQKAWCKSLIKPSYSLLRPLCRYSSYKWNLLNKHCEQNSYYNSCDHISAHFAPHCVRSFIFSFHQLWRLPGSAGKPESYPTAETNPNPEKTQSFNHRHWFVTIHDLVKMNQPQDIRGLPHLPVICFSTLK